VLSQKKRSILIIGIMTLGGFATLAGPSANAIESGGIGAIPANPQANNPRTKSIFVYEAKPNSVKTDAVKVINNSNTQKTIKVYAVDSQHSSDGAFACAQAVEAKKDVGSWVQLDKNEITLDAGKTEEIPFTVTVPANAETGEHNGCIAIEDVRAPKQQMENGIVLSFRSALRVAVTFPGKIEANLDFTNLIVNQQKDKIVVSPILKNAGNVSVDATIKISLNTLLNHKKAESEGTFVVLNKDESRFNIELSRPFWGGWYKLKSEATYAPLQQNPSGNAPKSATNSKSQTLFIAPHPTALLIYAILLVVLVASISYIVWRQRQLTNLRQDTVEYKVRAGDDIQVLAEKLAIDWRKLAKLNNLKAPYSLQVGQVIRVPQPRPVGKGNSTPKQG
jgi:hypothetical protein